MDDEKAKKTADIIYQKYNSVLDDYLNEKQFIDGFYDIVDPNRKQVAV